MRIKNPENLAPVRQALMKFDFLKFEESFGMLSLIVPPERLKEVLLFLKWNINCDFNVLMDLTAVDYLHKREESRRFEMVYLLFALKTKNRIRVKVELAFGQKVPSIVQIWKGANWPEREVFDLMGIEFEGHPNLTRLIMPDNYRGHPLRKDFPKEGLGEDYLIQDILLENQK